MSLHPVTNKIETGRTLWLGYQKYRGEEFGQIAFANLQGHGGVETRVLPYLQAEALYNEIQKVVEKYIKDI
jgi:hypothetical protein